MWCLKTAFFCSWLWNIFCLHITRFSDKFYYLIFISYIVRGYQSSFFGDLNHLTISDLSEMKWNEMDCKFDCEFNSVFESFETTNCLQIELTTAFRLCAYWATWRCKNCTAPPFDGCSLWRVLWSLLLSFVLFASAEKKTTYEFFVRRYTCPFTKL